MGMFDHIKVKMPLPDTHPKPNCEWFQTKDVPTVQLWLDSWIIEEDGRLRKVGYTVEDRSDKTLPDDDIRRFNGMMTRVMDPALDEIVQYHGDIEFHQIENDMWWSYVARFTDGICTRIWCADHHPLGAALQDGGEK